jgi:alkaline phosphatase D
MIKITQNLLIFIVVSFVGILLSCSENSTDSPSDKLQHNNNDSTWYNRKVGAAGYMLEIKNGNKQKAIDHARKQGEDAEAFYVLSAAYTAMAQYDSAMHYLHRSVMAGMPPERFIAGPKDFFHPLHNTRKYKRWLRKQKISLVHGPMLGTVSDTSAIFWARTAKESSLKFILSEDFTFENIIQSPEVFTSNDRELAEQVQVNGLKNNKEYYYKVVVDGEILPDVHSFITQPRQYSESEISIAFGGGAAYIPWHTEMWNTLAQHNLNGLLLLGDNVYIDYPEHPSIQEYCYHQRQSEKTWRELINQTPVYAIWDDHDFGDNDEYGGPLINEPAWKIPVYKTFMNQWANKSYGGGLKNPGVWFSFVMGDVEFFMLDGRFYREASFTNDQSIDRSMLGPVQKEWLLNGLSQSTATFKVIVSPVPWADMAKNEMEGRFDTWKGYKAERQEIFDHLTQENIAGVMLMSADRHRTDLWKLERENDYPLYEFESSRLTNTHTHRCIPEAEFCYNEDNSFGKLIFRTNVTIPEVEYQIWNIENQKVFSYTIPLTLLQ